MYWLIGLLLLEAALEGLLCWSVLSHQPLLRKLFCIALVVLQAGALGWLIGLRWQVWVWSLPFLAYRSINLLRVYVDRLPITHLQTVAFRAFGWLALGQLAVTGIAGAAYHFNLTSLFFDILVVLQLLAALVLLRASTHTWQHAEAKPVSEPLTDKKLPSLSVLVPARNENDDLERCLELLTASNYPKLEILVLDDCSAGRRTPDIIRSFAHAGVRFIQGAVPDETHWLAKNFAYEQLVRQASGDVLLFCGIDARFEPGALRSLVELLEARGKDMLSVMPLRVDDTKPRNTLLQSMRYYWEICLPRRLFKRPPVLSTCWLIRKAALERMGGFESVSRSVTPEAPLARRAVVNDAYSFIRSSEALGVYSDKPASEQYGTSVRVRYPQLHRRLELIALVSLFELVFLLGPFIGLCAVASLVHAMAYVALWAVSIFCLFASYTLVTVGARLTTPWLGWLLMPFAFMVDLAMLHISLWKYEFGTVEWKGRNVCIPVMQVEPHLPKA